MPTDGVPTGRELTAAYWAGRVLDTKGLTVEDRLASYRTLPIAGRLDVTDLEAAETLLRGAGLAHDDANRLAPSPVLEQVCGLPEEAAIELLLAAVLEKSTPVWLVAASGGSELRTELVPDGAQQILEDLLADPDRREAFLLSRGRKAELERRAAIGALGEEAVVAFAAAQLVSLGHPGLAAEVRQVSTISDELGYDVTAPRIDASTRRIEVKTTQAATTAFSIYLSRNEAAVGLADPNWHLVICALQNETDIEIVGWVRAEEIADRFPLNNHGDGAWESARLLVPTALLHRGLPPA